MKFNLNDINHPLKLFHDTTLKWKQQNDTYKIASNKQEIGIAKFFGIDHKKCQLPSINIVPFLLSVQFWKVS